jgi:hypothetical protein
MGQSALTYRVINRALLIVSLLLIALGADAQIQVELKLPRLQYIAYEPVMATLGIINLAGRDIDLRDAGGQSWLGFEVIGKDGETIAPISVENAQPPLKIEAGQKVTQRINLTPLYLIHEQGTYHVRAHVYFADLDRFFYSQSKAFEVTDARPIWQQTVGIPEGAGAAGDIRTYSLLTNRFPDHTSLYVRVQDRDKGIVYATYSLGRAIAFEEPQAEIDRANQLHVLHCVAPRSWAYSRIGLNGELITRSSLMETQTRPRLVRTADGEVALRGGMIEAAPSQKTRSTAPKLSERPPALPKDEQR